MTIGISITREEKTEMNNDDICTLGTTKELLRIYVKNTYKAIATLKRLGMSEDEIEELLDTMADKYSCIYEEAKSWVDMRK